MKKLAIVSVESFFAGVVKCGISEMVDSLANSLSMDYSTYLICPDGNGIYARAGGIVRTVEAGVRTCQFSNVTYYMIDPSMWLAKVPDVVARINPDIFHNLAEPELISMLHTRPVKAIYTFDSIDWITGKEKYITQYDSVTTVSNSYAFSLMRARSSASSTLMSTDFRGVTNGILGAVFAPEKGLLLPAKYTADNQNGKQLCKQKLMQTYGIKGDPCIYLTMCRLVEEKGLDSVIESIPTIKESGGMLIVVGKGDTKYEEQFRKLKRSDGVLYVNKWASPVQAAPLAAAADFFLQPSLMESCGLMPLTASRYGAIPIVTLNGGLSDSFNDENAIVVDYEGLDNAINRAAELYSDKEALSAKRKVCMEQDFSWKTRKAGYIELYEKG